MEVMQCRPTHTPASPFSTQRNPAFDPSSHALRRHLRTVEVVHVASGERWLFEAHDWVDKRCHWQRLLAASPAEYVLPARGF